MLKATIREFLDDDSPRAAAALAFYTVFALPPLLMLVLLLLGQFFEPQQIERAIRGQAGGLLGPEGASAIATMIESAERPGSGGVFTTILGIAGLLFGATGAFVQLQTALNRAWEVEPDPDEGGLKAFVGKRITSFGMLLAVVFLLLVSLVVSAAISAMGATLADMLPGALSTAAITVIELTISIAVIALLFAAIFKVLPEAEISWRDVAAGAIATAMLFVAGKFLIGLYLGRSEPGSAFGAAGSLAVLLLWVYYSSMIVLLGAEFTQVWARRRGEGIRPEPGAVRVIREKRRVRSTGATAD